MPPRYKTYKPKFKGPTKAGIYRSDRDGWLKVVTPYHPDFVDALKSSIQPPHRTWDPDAKCWYINEMFLEDITKLCQRYYNEVETNLAEPEASDNNTNSFVELFDILPEDLVDKVYYSLSLALHPDRGGSNELVSQLNKAYKERK